MRKAAVQLLTSLLESNPFAARLETEDLVKKLEEEEKKLAALCPEEVAWISITVSSSASLSASTSAST